MALSQPEDCIFALRDQDYMWWARHEYAQFDKEWVYHPNTLAVHCRPISDQEAWPAQITSPSWLCMFGGFLQASWFCQTVGEDHVLWMRDSYENSELHCSQMLLIILQIQNSISSSCWALIMRKKFLFFLSFIPSKKVAILPCGTDKVRF